MQNGNWGHCKNCKYFGSPAARPLEAEEARCHAPKLDRFNLRIYGSNGCNQWELRPGLPAPDAQRSPQDSSTPGMGIEEGTLQ